MRLVMSLPHRRSVSHSFLFFFPLLPSRMPGTRLGSNTLREAYPRSEWAAHGPRKEKRKRALACLNFPLFFSTFYFECALAGGEGAAGLFPRVERSRRHRRGGEEGEGERLRGGEWTRHAGDEISGSHTLILHRAFAPNCMRATCSPGRDGVVSSVPGCESSARRGDRERPTAPTALISPLRPAVVSRAARGGRLQRDRARAQMSVMNARLS